MVALNDVFKDATIIKISENKKLESLVFSSRINPIGKYRKIVTPQGVVEKSTTLKLKPLKNC